MSDWSKDINLEAINEYLHECAENDDYHYEQYQVDIVMHEYIRQKQVIQAITNENERLNNIINRTTKYVQSLSSKGRGCDIYEDIKQEILKELKGSDKE